VSLRHCLARGVLDTLGDLTDLVGNPSEGILTLLAVLCAFRHFLSLLESSRFPVAAVLSTDLRVLMFSGNRPRYVHLRHTYPLIRYTNVSGRWREMSPKATRYYSFGSRQTQGEVRSICCLVLRQ
jgi:hypothetical protein